MNHIVSQLKTYLLMGFCISLCLVSCKENNDDLGVNISPENERLLVVSDSSATIKAYSVPMENTISIRSSSLLGHINDPLLGSFKSSFVAAARPRVLSADFGDSVLIDSMFLYVKYDTLYGEFNYEHTLSVYEIFRDSMLNVSDLSGEPDDISSIANYYSDDNLLLTANYTPEVRYVDSTVIKAMKFDLLNSANGKALAERLVHSDDSVYDHINYFKEFVFNGLYFEAHNRTKNGAMIRVVGSDSTRVTIYYRKLVLADTAKNKFDTTSQTLNIELYSDGRANIYERKYNNDVQIFDTLTEPEADVIDSIFYIQGVNGLNGRIVIEGLNSILPDSIPIAINRALISIQVEDSSFTNPETFTVLPSIIVTVEDENPYLDEYLNNGSYSAISFLNASSVSSNFFNTFTFNVTSRIVQYHKEGKDKVVFNLIAANRHINPSRVVLKGQNNKTFPIQLKLTYTKINTK